MLQVSLYLPDVCFKQLQVRQKSNRLQSIWSKNILEYKFCTRTGTLKSSNQNTGFIGYFINLYTNFISCTYFIYLKCFQIFPRYFLLFLQECRFGFLSEKKIYVIIQYHHTTSENNLWPTVNSFHLSSCNITWSAVQQKHQVT
jgi:hypothetical protein